MQNDSFSPLACDPEQNNDWQFENPIIAVDISTGEILARQNLFGEGEITVEEKAKKRAQTKIAIARETLPKETLQAEIEKGKRLKEIAELYGLELQLVTVLRKEYGLEYEYDRSQCLMRGKVAPKKAEAEAITGGLVVPKHTNTYEPSQEELDADFNAFKPLIKPEQTPEPEPTCQGGCSGCAELFKTIQQVTQLQDERADLVEAFNRLGNMFREHTEAGEIREIKGQGVEISIRVIS